MLCKVTAPHSALFCDPRAPKELDGAGTFNIHSAVKAWTHAGVDPKKLIIGAAAYGREVSGVTPTDKKSYLYAEFSGQGSTPLYYNPNMGQSIITQLDHNLTKGNDGSDYNYGFAYAYDTDTKSFVSFDSNASVTLKSCYVAYMKLGGIMFWDLGADTGNELVNTSMSIRDDVENRCFGNFSFDRIKELIVNSEECSRDLAFNNFKMPTNNLSFDISFEYYSKCGVCCSRMSNYKEDCERKFHECFEYMKKNTNATCDDYSSHFLQNYSE